MDVLAFFVVEEEFSPLVILSHCYCSTNLTALFYVLKLHSEKREKKSPLIESTANMDNNQTQKTFKK